jgi:hypothetical protein
MCLVAILGTQAVLLLEARTTNSDDQTAVETVIKHTLTTMISIRALPMLLAAEYVEERRHPLPGSMP